MPDLVNGLPLHPLVVHAVVVLLPLAILGTVAIVAVPRWRRPYGPLVLGVAVLAVLVSVAAGVQVYRVGDSGARAACGDRVGPAAH